MKLVAPSFMFFFLFFDGFNIPTQWAVGQSLQTRWLLESGLEMKPLSLNDFLRLTWEHNSKSAILWCRPLGLGHRTISETSQKESRKLELHVFSVFWCLSENIMKMRGMTHLSSPFPRHVANTAPPNLSALSNSEGKLVNMGNAVTLAASANL